MSRDQPARRGFDRTLEAALGLVTAGVLFCLMLLTCADVVGRYFFNEPVTGAFELTELLLAATIFCALPLVTLREQHVTVDLLDDFTPDWLLRVQHVAACSVGALALSVLTWRLWVRGDTFLEAGQTTAVLKLKLAPVAYGMSVLLALTVVVLLVLLFRAPHRAAHGD